MHETAIMDAVIRIVAQVAQENRLSEIRSFRIRIGALAGVVPEALQFAFEVMRRGTCVEHAQMELEMVPATFECENCGLKIESHCFEYVCENCGGQLRLVDGNTEIRLLTINGPGSYCQNSPRAKTPPINE